MAGEPVAAAVVTDPPAAPSRTGGAEVPRIRRCGRCREPQAWNPAEPPAAAAAWFLCPPCRAALTGATGRGRHA